MFSPKEKTYLNYLVSFLSAPKFEILLKFEVLTFTYIVPIIISFTEFVVFKY